MPPPKRTTCKVQGCNNPSYVFPGGWKHTLCQEHLRLRNTKQRGDLPSMSGQMRALLQYLREMDEQGFGFVELRYPLAHGATINALIGRDWIFPSKGIDGTRYRITKRGIEALKVYEPVLNRRDGICPKCGVTERHINGNGRREAFCLECERARGRAKNAKAKMNIQRPCSRCHEQPCHQYAGGSYSTYCLDCENARGRERRRREMQALLEAIRNGAPVPMCQKCKVKPRRVSANCVANYCDECKRVEQRRYKLSRRLKILAGA